MKTHMLIGFLVNPIAGMGGKVGLKGTDGVFKKAVRMGAKPVAPERGMMFLKKLKELGGEEKIQFVTCPSVMGADVIYGAGLNAHVLALNIHTETTGDDTKEAVKLMVEHEVDLILFVGGDGTARDVLDGLEASNRSTPVLGIPSGVKLYSGVFAVNPTDAAYIVEAFLKKETQLMDLEVIDADETAIRNDLFKIRLYGILKGPYMPMRIQGSKQVSSDRLDEHENQLAVARFVVEDMVPEDIYILGPGTTVKCVAELLGVEKTLLGVDVYHDGRILRDVNEEQILREIDDWGKTWIVVSPVGRQGILFGRGNQQISPKIIRLVGKERIVVMATKNKVRGFEGGVLRVDTGDAAVETLFGGYIKVATDYREWRLLQVK